MSPVLDELSGKASGVAVRGGGSGDETDGEDEDETADSGIDTKVKTYSGSSNSFESATPSGKACTLKEDSQQTFIPCDPTTQKSNVHFFYPPELDCGPKSESLAPFVFPDADCLFGCKKDGYFTEVDLRQQKQVCNRCPENSVSINDGVRLEGLNLFSQYLEFKCMYLKISA